MDDGCCVVCVVLLDGTVRIKFGQVRVQLQTGSQAQLEEERSL